LQLIFSEGGYFRNLSSYEIHHGIRFGLSRQLPVGFVPPDDTRRRLFRPWHGTGERPTRNRLRSCMRWDAMEKSRSDAVLLHQSCQLLSLIRDDDESVWPRTQWRAY